MRENTFPTFPRADGSMSIWRLSVLDQVALIVQPVDKSLYEDYQEAASARVFPRDPDDWPVAAVALLLDLPIWTEDQDFFGSGIAIWTTDRVELFLREL